MAASLDIAVLGKPLVRGPIWTAVGLGTLDAQIGVDNDATWAARGVPYDPTGLCPCRCTPMTHGAQASEQATAVHHEAVTSDPLPHTEAVEATGYEAGRGSIVVNEQWLATGPEHVFLAVRKSQVDRVDRSLGAM